MTNATTASSRTCNPPPRKPTTGFATCLPSKSSTSSGVSHHPVLSPSFPEYSPRPPPMLLPTLLPITHTSSGHPVARPGWPVTPGLHAAPKSSSGKPSQSRFVSPQFVATLNSYPTHSPVPAPVNTAAWPLIPSSHVSNSHSSYSVRDGLPSNASYEPSMPSPAPTTYRTATLITTGTPGRLQSIFCTVTSAVNETPQSTFPTPVSIAETTDGQLTVPPSTTSMGATTLAYGGAVSNPVQGASSFSVGHS